MPVSLHTQYSEIFHFDSHKSLMYHNHSEQAYASDEGCAKGVRMMLFVPLVGWFLNVLVSN